MKQTLVRLLLTLLVVGCAAHVVLFERPVRFPIDWRIVDAHTMVVERAEQGSRLRRGDRLDLRQQDMAARAALYLNTIPGEAFTLTVKRGGELLRVAVSKKAPTNPRPDYLNALLLALLLALGLVTLWWGRDWTAWGLSLFAIAFVVNVFLFLSMPAPATVAVMLFNWTLITPLITLGLYATALALSAGALAPPIRVGFHVVLAVVLLASLALTDAQLLALVIFGDAWLWEYGLSGVFFALSVLIPFAVLLAAYPHATPERRLRLRWVIISLTLLLGPVVWLNLGIRGANGLVWWTIILCGAGGLLYAVLRRRVVAMSFAVNRALAFAVIAAFVLGIFALLATVVERTALDRDAGLALTLGVSLAVGLVLETLRDRINSAIERLFFRRRYAAERALSRFARHSAYITRRDRLLDEFVQQLEQHIQPDALAVYQETQDGYVRVRQGGRSGFPERVDVDDRAFVQLRAETSDLNLLGTESALGREGHLYPMAVRGSLLGAVICGPRPEAYTKDERNLIAQVAHQVGLALHALRAHENEAFIESFANGALETSVARTTAQHLHSRWARQSRPPAS